MRKKPKLLVLSHVLPFPQSSGQQQRVFYSLKALRRLFHLTFATSVTKGNAEQVRSKLLEYCDDVVLLPSVYRSSRMKRTWHQAAGGLSTLRTGLKFSNYVIGKLEFSPNRVASHLTSLGFDCALFEYWHASESASVFRNQGIPCVLDMHDILWKAHERQLDERAGLPEWWKRRTLNQYKAREEEAWRKFDGLIAINNEELNYVAPRVPSSTNMFYTPMGTDLDLWSYSWKPEKTIKVAYYGGLGSHHNQEDALKCANHIMPHVWKEFPKAELWLIGSNPPQRIIDLRSDSRIKVTGFVKDVQQLLPSMSVVVCPWTGTYGFRSRLIEVLAIGVPLVASRDAVWGMGLSDSPAVLLGETDHELAEQAMTLLNDQSLSRRQSQLGRQWVEEAFSFENTYGRFAQALTDWLATRKASERFQKYA